MGEKDFHIDIQWADRRGKKRETEYTENHIRLEQESSTKLEVSRHSEK